MGQVGTGGAVAVHANCGDTNALIVYSPPQ